MMHLVYNVVGLNYYEVIMRVMSEQTSWTLVSLCEGADGVLYTEETKPLARHFNQLQPVA
jgi:hypothetical protein